MPIFHLVFGLPCLFVLARFLWPLQFSPRAKIATAVMLVIVAQFHLWNRFSSGSVFSPEYPRTLVILFNWGYSAILILALLQLAVDLVMLLTMVVRHRRSTIHAKTRYAMALAAAALAAFGVQQAIRQPPVKAIEIAVAGLPPQFDGYTVLHMTDIHISRLFDASWTSTLVSRANALQPDLIVVTGDLIDGTVAARAADTAPLSRLRARDGVLVSPGNHEHFFGYKEWRARFASLGLHVLANSYQTIERGDKQLVVAGLADLTAPNTGFPPPNLRLALAGAPKGAPIVLLDHHPTNAKEAAAHGVSLQLSGHTHGGLVFGFGWIFALLNGGYVSGLYDVGGMPLYVSNGTAIWPGLALRIGRPSELTLITLRPARDGLASQPAAER